MSHSAPSPLSRSARVARVESEERFGARLRGWLHRGEAKATDVARLLGVSRNDLYDTFEGAKHFRAAWIELLPPSVELLFLAERAQHHAMRLAPIATTESTMVEVIAYIGQVLTLCGQSEADGWVDPQEAARDLDALRAMQRKLEELVAHRERALAEHGLAVLPGARR